MEDRFVCDDCRLRRHPCAVCGLTGDDDNEVFKCSMHSCGLYYHRRCLQKLDNVRWEVDVQQSVLPWRNNNSSSSNNNNKRS